MAFSLLDTCYVAILSQGGGLPTAGTSTSAQTGVEGFYATLCTGGVTYFLPDTYSDHGTTFDEGDVVVLERTTDSTYWCATIGSTNIDVADDYVYSGNFYDVDCAACIANGYGS